MIQISAPLSELPPAVCPMKIEPPPVESTCEALAVLGRPPTVIPDTHYGVLALYIDRTDIEATMSHGAVFIHSGGRELDVSRDDGGWWALRSWDLSDEEPVRVHTRADLDAHVAWVAGEVS